MKKNGRGILRTAEPEPWVRYPPVLKGDHASRRWAGAIPLSLLSERQLGQRYKERAVGRCSPTPVWEAVLSLMRSPCPSHPLLSFCVLFCLFSPLPLYSLCFILSSVSSQIHFPAFLSHPPSHIILQLFFLLSLLSSPPALAQQGRSWQQGTSTAVALPLLLPPVHPWDTSLRMPGGQGGLIEKSGRFRS